MPVTRPGTPSIVTSRSLSSSPGPTSTRSAVALDVPPSVPHLVEPLGRVAQLVAAGQQPGERVRAVLGGAGRRRQLLALDLAAQRLPRLIRPHPVGLDGDPLDAVAGVGRRHLADRAGADRLQRHLLGAALVEVVGPRAWSASPRSRKRWTPNRNMNAHRAMIPASRAMVSRPRGMRGFWLNVASAGRCRVGVSALIWTVRGNGCPNHGRLPLTVTSATASDPGRHGQGQRVDGGVEVAGLVERRHREVDRRVALVGDDGAEAGAAAGGDDARAQPDRRRLDRVDVQPEVVGAAAGDVDRRLDRDDDEVVADDRGRREADVDRQHARRVREQAEHGDRQVDPARDRCPRRAP